MIHSTEIINHLNGLLKPQRFRDYAPNGLQVQGSDRVRKIITAVSASQRAIDFAIEQEAEMLLVHHGYFWKHENPVVEGLKAQRLAKLLRHQINLVAYHLPLDQHERFGNNALFAEHFDCVEVWQSLVEALIWHAEIKPIAAEELRRQLSQQLGREALMLGESRGPVSRIGWCTGAAQDYFSQAVAEGAQLFISGEYAERTYHEANELGALYISCGHHASERAGVRALGEYLGEEFGLTVRFFDEPNPL